MRLWWRSLENGRTRASCKMILQRLFGHPCDVGLDRMLWRVGRVLSRRLKFLRGRRSDNSSSILIC